ncbi:MAG: hypothetical protein MUC36_14450 [Planctomycetes bacterium]|jgi:hypothetical protein|nr:hypothetical protein [Planctomycetota bacterium]
MRFLLSLLSALALPAQGFVSPSHFAAVEGTGSSQLPFGTQSLPARYLQVHDGVPAQTITGLAFRHDTNGTVRPAFTLTVDVWLSTAVAPAAAAVAGFDANHGVDKRHVIVNRTVTVPANDPARLPGAFLLDLPFDPGQDFVFAGGGASLCWEVQVTANSSLASNVPFDAVQTQGPTPSAPGLVGTRAYSGCVATGRTQPIAIAPLNSSVDWVAGLAQQRVSGQQLLANGIVVWASGSGAGSWSGAPLPILLPTTTGAPSGTCTLFTDPAWLTAGVASASGTALLQLQYAVTPALHGALLPVQLIGLDAAANALGITTSNLVVQQLVAPYPAAPGIQRVYAVGGLAATGTVDAGSPLITRFQ